MVATHCDVLESFEPKRLTAFSHVFNLEKYSDEENTVYGTLPHLDEWFSGYVEPTMQNIYKAQQMEFFYKHCGL